MKSFSFFSLSFFLGVLLSLEAYAVDPVVARVNGKSFTYSQVMEGKKALPPSLQSSSEEKLFPLLLKQTIDGYLMQKAAQTSKVKNTPEVKRAIAKLSEEVVLRAYLGDQLKNLITDKALKEKFEASVKQLPQEKEAHLLEILVPSEEEAKRILKALGEGKDFKEMAKTKSKSPSASKSGDLGFVRRSLLPKDLGDLLFTLAPGSYTRIPLKTDQGYYIFKVESLREAKVPSFEESKETLKLLLLQDAVNDLAATLRAKAKIETFDQQGNPFSLEDLQKKNK